MEKKRNQQILKVNSKKENENYNFTLVDRNLKFQSNRSQDKFV